MNKRDRTPTLLTLLLFDDVPIAIELFQIISAALNVMIFQ